MEFSLKFLDGHPRWPGKEKDVPVLIPHTVGRNGGMGERYEGHRGRSSAFWRESMRSCSYPSCGRSTSYYKSRKVLVLGRNVVLETKGDLLGRCHVGRAQLGKATRCWQVRGEIEERGARQLRLETVKTSTES